VASIRITGYLALLVVPGVVLETEFGVAQGAGMENDAHINSITVTTLRMFAPPVGTMAREGPSGPFWRCWRRRLCSGGYSSAQIGGFFSNRQAIEFGQSLGVFSAKVSGYSVGGIQFQ
jgi:hypothetical protein